MRALHLFAGGGGSVWASRLLGWRSVGCVELDPFCCAVLEKIGEKVLARDVMEFTAAGASAQGERVGWGEPRGPTHADADVVGEVDVADPGQHTGPEGHPRQPSGFHMEGGVLRDRSAMAVGEAGSGSSESRVGRATHGLADWQQWPAARGDWPAGRGEAQHSWESPRIISSVRDSQRSHRLKLLGNGWVPHQAVHAWRSLTEDF